MAAVPRGRRRAAPARSGPCLLDAAIARCRAEGRSRLTGTVPLDHAPGMAFAQASGATIGLLTEQNRLRVAELDRGLLRGWVDRVAERARGYSIVAFDGVCPDDWLEPFARLTRVMNTAPRAETVEDVTFTTEQVRDNMTAYARRGHQSWTVCGHHDATDELVGFTELGFSPHRPWLAIQGDTAVEPAHRNRGLGRWVKALNALRLLDERPDVQQVGTWNAGVNAPMLSINRAMGFRPAAAWQEWELAL